MKGGRVRAACTITDPSTLDEVWIPETARQEWLIITRDRHIQDHRAEIEAVRSSGARMVNLAADDATDRFAQMEVIMCPSAAGDGHHGLRGLFPDVHCCQQITTQK